MERFIPHVHEEVRRALLTRRGATQNPEDVPRGLFKVYPRMQQFSLPEPEPIAASLDETLLKRRSYLGGTMVSVISKELWGTLLGLSLKQRLGSTSRNYPSGGGLYPVETYILGRVFGERPAAFHYNPGAHALEKLWDLPRDFDLKDLSRKPDELLFSALIVFTSVWKRSSAKYGNLSYSHALLEAGHMSQNILLAATALNLLSRPMAGFSDELVIRHLDIDPEEEQPVHCVALSVSI